VNLGPVAGREGVALVGRTLSELRQEGDAQYQKRHCALDFWNGWIFAHGTDWVEHQQFPRDAWPALARSVAADLLADREISEPRVRLEFDLTATLRLPKEYLRNPWAHFDTFGW
jgi:hypothetical protein